ncbi:hypothetical protein L915_07278, partial [Phytophthora nicotianae]
SSESTISTGQPSRIRPTWQLIWWSSQSTGGTLEGFMASLPSRATVKNDCYPYTMHHTALVQEDPRCITNLHVDSTHNL